MPRGHIVIIASNMPRALRHNGHVHFVFGYEVTDEREMRFIEFKEAKGEGENLQLSIGNVKPQDVRNQNFRWQASLDGEIDADSLDQFVDSLKEEGKEDGFHAGAPGQPFARGYNGLSLTLFFLKLAGYAKLITCSDGSGLYQGLFVLGSGATMANYHHFCQASNIDLDEKDLEASLKAATKGSRCCRFFCCSDPGIRVEFSKGLQYEDNAWYSSCTIS